jgi:hypothetical protein
LGPQRPALRWGLWGRYCRYCPWALLGQIPKGQ